MRQHVTKSFMRLVNSTGPCEIPKQDSVTSEKQLLTLTYSIRFSKEDLISLIPVVGLWLR